MFAMYFIYISKTNPLKLNIFHLNLTNVPPHPQISPEFHYFLEVRCPHAIPHFPSTYTTYNPSTLKAVILSLFEMSGSDMFLYSIARLVYAMAASRMWNTVKHFLRLLFFTICRAPTFLRVLIFTIPIYLCIVAGKVFETITQHCSK